MFSEWTKGLFAFHWVTFKYALLTLFSIDGVQVISGNLISSMTNTKQNFFFHFLFKIMLSGCSIKSILCDVIFLLSRGCLDSLSCASNSWTMLPFLWTPMYGQCFSENFFFFFWISSNSSLQNFISFSKI